MSKSPWFCRCGKTFRSAMAEARHRHNFPLLCHKTPTGRYASSQPNIQQINPKTPEGAAIRAALIKVFKS